MSERPRISVIVTAHGRRGFLADALASVANQTLEPTAYEVLVAKDFPDEAIDRSIAERGWRAIDYREPAMGPMFGRCVEAARGRVLAFLDDDDRFVPGKLAEVDRRFRRDPDLGYLHHWFAVIDERGERRPDGPFRAAERRHRAALGLVSLRPADRMQRLRRLPPVGLDFGNSCLCVRADLLRAHLDTLASEAMFTLDTFAFFAALLAPCSLEIDPGRLTEYRLHPANTSLPQTPVEAQRHWARIAASYAAIREMVERSGDEAVRREAEALVLLHQIDRALSGERPGRSTCFALGRRGLAVRGTYFWNSRTNRLGHYGLALALLAGAIVPRVLDRWQRPDGA